MARAVLIVFAAGLCASHAHAWDFVWTGAFDARDDEWSVPAHWDGQFGLFPSTRSDSAQIGGASIFDPVLDVDVAIGAVTISGGHTLDTNGFEYSVFNSGGLSGDTIIEGAGSLLLVRDDVNNANDAGSGFIINDGGTLRLDPAGQATVNARKLAVAAGALVEGAGTLAQLGRFGAPSIDGALRATGGTLVLQPWDAGAVLDWDGSSGDGEIEVDDDSELRIEMGVEPVFDGTITLRNDAVLEVQDDWTLSGAAGARFEAINTAATPARIRGDDLTLAGTVDLESGSLVFEAGVTALPGALIRIGGPHFARFEAPATLGPSAISYIPVGAPSLFIESDVTISGPGTHDLDGPNEDNVLLGIGPGGTLAIDVGRIDTGDDRYDGSLTIDGGALDVNVDSDEWAAAGPVDLTGATISGDRLRVEGAMSVHAPGTSHITAPFTLAPSGSVDVPAGAVLRLAGLEPAIVGYDAVFEGGVISGAGEVLCDFGTANVSGPTAVVMPEGTFNMNGSDFAAWTIGGPLQIVAASIYDDSTTPIDDVLIWGSLSVDLIGTDECVFRLVTFTPGPFEPNARLLGPDRVVITQAFAALDIDAESLAPIRCMSGSTLFASEGVALLGGDEMLPDVFESGVHVDSLDTNNGPGGSPRPLVLGGWTVIEEDVTFETRSNGEYALIRVTGVLDLRGDIRADIDDENAVLVEIAGGTLKLGAPGATHTAAIDRLAQDADGLIEIDISGAEGATSFDRIVLGNSGASELLGTLSIAAIDGYVPQHADAFEIIVGLDGPPSVDFAQVNAPERVRVETIGDSVWARFLLCDADLAEPYGTLDFSDVFAFLVAFGAMTPEADLAEPLGVFDFSDVFAFLTAFGAGCP